MAKRKSERSPDAFDWAASLIFVIIVIVSQYLERGDNPFVRFLGLVVIGLACVFFSTLWIPVSWLIVVCTRSFAIRSIWGTCS